MDARDMRALSDARMILHRLRFDDAPCDDRLDNALYRAGDALGAAILRLRMRDGMRDWAGCTDAERALTGSTAPAVVAE